MTKENKTSWEDEIKRICDSYTDEARDFNTDLEDHLISFISNLITLQRAEERELLKKMLRKVLSTKTNPKVIEVIIEDLEEERNSLK